jgi:hypothetical protein
MIVSLTKIYCPFELKQKRTPTVYRNVTEFNNKNNTVMIVSLTKIYCPSDIKQKRTPTVYRNVTQHNNQQNTQPCQCHQVTCIVHLTLSRKERPPSIRTSHSIVINKNTAMIVSLIKIYHTSDLSRKELLAI